MAKHHIALWYDHGSDPHLGEYIPEYWNTRQWLSGFSGSAGKLVITQDFAGLWTDSRYFIQAEKELMGTEFVLFRSGIPGVPSVEAFIFKNLPLHSVIGFNGKCIPAALVEIWANLFSEKSYKIKDDIDLVDQIWHDRPLLPINPAFRYALSYAGETSSQKIKRLREDLSVHHIDGMFIVLLDEIAWLLNIRGNDIPFSPLVLSYLWIDQQKVVWFIDPKKVPNPLLKELTKEEIFCKPYSDVDKVLLSLCMGKHVSLDPTKISYHFAKIIKKNSLQCKETESPITHFKSIKNNTEQKGIQQAHIRDGVAMVRWMVWLQNNLTKEHHTEYTIAEKLNAFRAKQPLFHDLSFSTIVAYQENGAIVHYIPIKESAVTVNPYGILLVDSGGHYLDGTTDITRTLALSEPTAEQKHFFTLVLKGLIHLSQVIFPEGSTGANLDSLARQFLWQEGFNYGHSTGHGVGCFLTVHEGPQRISSTSMVPLKAGMLLSNEPGIYFEGNYGIRIENLMICQPSSKKGYFAFKTVSLCPIDLSLVDTSLLTPDERHWLNAYHATVCEKLSPHLSPKEKKWLKNQTRDI